MGLKEGRRKEAADGSYILVYLRDGITDFELELTWLKDRSENYDLGDEEFHLAFRVDDYEAAYKNIKKWAVSHTKILVWEFILLQTLMDIGWKLFRLENS